MDSNHLHVYIDKNDRRRNGLSNGNAEGQPLFAASNRYVPVLTPGLFSDFSHEENRLVLPFCGAAAAFPMQPIIINKVRATRLLGDSLVDEMTKRRIAAQISQSHFSTNNQKHMIETLLEPQLLERILVEREVKTQSLKRIGQILGHKKSEFKNSVYIKRGEIFGEIQGQTIHQQLTANPRPKDSQESVNSYKSGPITNSRAISSIETGGNASLHHNTETVPTHLQVSSNITSDQKKTSQQPSSHAPPCLQDNGTKTKGRPSVFPQKLYQMLSDLENVPGGVEIASFLPHGRAFAIHRRKDFMNDVIPNYFSLTSIASFERQLRMYNFRQISAGPDKGAYFHKLFIRGQPTLSLVIKRGKD